MASSRTRSNVPRSNSAVSSHVDKEADENTGYQEVRFRTLRAGDKKPVYPKAFAAGEVGKELAECKRRSRPVLVSGHVEAYTYAYEKDGEELEGVNRRYVIDEIISTNSTNYPGEEGDRDVVEYGGRIANTKEPKATRRPKEDEGDPGFTFRTVEIQQPGATPPLSFGVFEKVGEEFGELNVGKEVCVLAFEGTYFRKPRMRRATNILGVVDHRPTPQNAEPGCGGESSEVPGDGDQSSRREPSGSLSDPIF